MTEQRPIWQDGGIHHLPTCEIIEEWASKMDPAVFKMNGDIRRAYRTTYGERLAMQGTIILGVLAGCAIVWQVVWGVMA